MGNKYCSLCGTILLLFCSSLVANPEVSTVTGNVPSEIEHTVQQPSNIHPPTTIPEDPVQSPPAPQQPVPIQPPPDGPAEPPQVEPGTPPSQGNTPMLPLEQPVMNLSSQIELLVVNDHSQGNSYVTTLNSSGSALTNSPVAVIYGTRHPGNRKYYPVIWYPHRNATDILRFTDVEPKGVFSGLTNDKGQTAQGLPSAITLPAQDYVNLLIGPEALDAFINADSANYNLIAHEDLQGGGKRRVNTRVSKKAQITLQRPGRIECRDEHVEGVEGKICTLRLIEVAGDISNSGDIQFIVRSSLVQSTQGKARYRVGDQWHLLGVPVPVAQFSHSKGLDLFIPKLSAEEELQLAYNMATLPLSSLLEAGFYSASRYQYGDLFSLGFNDGKLPENNNQMSMSRQEVLLIEDLVTSNQYVTTQSSTGGQKSAPVLFGVHSPQSGDHPAIWYAQGVSSPPLQRNSEVILAPAGYFSGFSFQGGAATDAPTFSPRLSQEGWQALNTMAAGNGQLWRMDINNSIRRQAIMSHLSKMVHLYLSQPDSSQCRREQMNGISGQICQLRKVTWQGVMTTGDTRFVIRAKNDADQAHYRVGGEWKALGNSIPLSEFIQNASIEIFYPDTVTHHAAEQRQSTANPLESLQMKFFSQSRIGQRDQFTIPLRVELSHSQQDLPTAQKEPLNLPVPYVAIDAIAVTAMIDGIADSIKPSNSTPAKNFVQLAFADAPLSKEGEVQITIKNVADQRYLKTGYIQFYPSMQTTDSELFWDKKYTIPLGTTGFYIYFFGHNISQGLIKKVEHVIITATVEGTIQKTDTFFRLLGSNYAGHVQVKELTVRPEFVGQGGMAEFFVTARNLQFEGRYNSYALICMPHASINANNDFEKVIEAPNGKYDLYDADGNLIGSMPFSKDNEHEKHDYLISYEQLTNNRKIRIPLKIKKDAPQNAKVELKCKLEKDDVKRVGQWAHKIIYTATADELKYSVNAVSGRDGIEQAIGQATMSVQPLEAKTLYYRITPANGGDFSAEEKSGIKVSYHNGYTSAKPESGKLSGTISVGQYEYWIPTLTIAYERIKEEKTVKFTFSTEPIVAQDGAQQLSTTATIKPKPLLITLPNAHEIQPGHDIVLPIQFPDRKTYDTDYLYFKLITSPNDEPPLSDVMKLDEAYLYYTSPGSRDQEIDLTTDEKAVSLKKLADVSQVHLVIPGKFPSARFKDKKFRLQVNWGKTVSSSGAQTTNVTILPFPIADEEIYSMQWEKEPGNKNKQFKGVIGSSGIVQERMNISWKIPKTISLSQNEGNDLQKRIHQRAIRDLNNVDLYVTGTPANGMPEGGNKERLYCTLTTDSQSRPANMQIPIASFLFVDGGEKFWHGCRGQAAPYPLGNKKDNWQSSDDPDAYRGRVTVTMGFDFNDPASNVESWIGGTATGQGQIVLAPKWQ